MDGTPMTVAQCSDWRSLVVGVNSVLVALAGMLGAYTVAKLSELRTRVKDVQHKVGADQRANDH